MRAGAVGCQRGQGACAMSEGSRGRGACALLSLSAGLSEGSGSVRAVCRRGQGACALSVGGVRERALSLLAVGGRGQGACALSETLPGSWWRQGWEAEIKQRGNPPTPRMWKPPPMGQVASEKEGMGRGREPPGHDPGPLAGIAMHPGKAGGRPHWGGAGAWGTWPHSLVEKKGHALPDALWVWRGLPGTAQCPPTLSWHRVPQVHVHLEPQEGTQFEKRVTADITEMWIPEIILGWGRGAESSDASFGRHQRGAVCFGHRSPSGAHGGSMTLLGCRSWSSATTEWLKQ